MRQEFVLRRLRIQGSARVRSRGWAPQDLDLELEPGTARSKQER
jgi:hypothetical protein